MWKFLKKHRKTLGFLMLAACVISTLWVEGKMLFIPLTIAVLLVTPEKPMI